jgi:hypothetical protein
MRGMSNILVAGSLVLSGMAAVATAASAQEACSSGKLAQVELFAGNPLWQEPKARPVSGQPILDPEAAATREGSSVVPPRWGGPTALYEEKGQHYFFFSDDQMTWAVPLDPGSPHYKKMFRIVGQPEKSFVQFGKCNGGSGEPARFHGSPYMAQLRGESGALKDELLVADPYGNFVGILKHPLDAERCELVHLAGNPKNGSSVQDGRPPHRGNTKGEGNGPVCGADVQFWNVEHIVPDVKDPANRRVFVFDKQGAQSTKSEIDVLDVQTGCVERLVTDFPHCHVTGMAQDEASGNLYLSCNQAGGEAWIYEVDPRTDKAPRKYFVGGQGFWVGDRPLPPGDERKGTDKTTPLLQGLVSSGKYLYTTANGRIFRLEAGVKSSTFEPAPEPLHVAGVGAYDRHSKYFETTGYDFFARQPADKAAFPYNQADGPVYGGTFSRLFLGPKGDDLYYCGRYRYGSACFRIGCGE